jgi:hypothetical protein
MQLSINKERKERVYLVFVTSAYSEHSLIFSYEEEFTCIHIVSPEIAKSFDSFFESMWKIAKE